MWCECVGRGPHRPLFLSPRCAAATLANLHPSTCCPLLHHCTPLRPFLSLRSLPIPILRPKQHVAPPRLLPLHCCCWTPTLLPSASLSLLCCLQVSALSTPARRAPILAYWYARPASRLSSDSAHIHSSCCAILVSENITLETSATAGYATVEAPPSPPSLPLSLSTAARTPASLPNLTTSTGAIPRPFRFHSTSTHSRRPPTATHAKLSKKQRPPALVPPSLPTLSALATTAQVFPYTLRSAPARRPPHRADCDHVHIHIHLPAWSIYVRHRHART